MPIELHAYPVSAVENWTIVPAGPRRDWMDGSNQKFAYRCLPLVMANQAGWFLTSPFSVTAEWNGGTRPGSIKLFYPGGQGRNFGQVNSHFGEGVLTFTLPWLFRTSPGYGLWVRGPTNAVKDGAAALDGIVETDWAPYTFTMNWKLTRKHTPVHFAKGEPVCMIVPFPLALLEDVEPSMRNMATEPVLHQDFEAFRAGRAANLQKLAETREPVWQMDYMRGHLPDGREVKEHRKAFTLAEFVRRREGEETK